jgi:hypothetical protein
LWGWGLILLVILLVFGLPAILVAWSTTSGTGDSGGGWWLSVLPFLLFGVLGVVLYLGRADAAKKLAVPLTVLLLFAVAIMFLSNWLGTDQFANIGQNIGQRGVAATEPDLPETTRTTGPVTLSEESCKPELRTFAESWRTLYLNGDLVLSFDREKFPLIEMKPPEGESDFSGVDYVNIRAKGDDPVEIYTWTRPYGTPPCTF